MKDKIELTEEQKRILRIIYEFERQELRNIAEILRKYREAEDAVKKEAGIPEEELNYWTYNPEIEAFVWVAQPPAPEL